MEQKEHNRSLSWTEFIMDSSSSTLVFSRNVGLSGLSWKSFRLVGWQPFEILNQRKSSCRSITFVTKSHFCSVCFILEFWLFQRKIPIKKPNQTALLAHLSLACTTGTSRFPVCPARLFYSHNRSGFVTSVSARIFAWVKLFGAFLVSHTNGGTKIFVGRIFNEPGLGRAMLSFIFYLSCSLSNISAFVFWLICVISVAFNQFYDIDFSTLSLLAAVIIYLFIGFIFKYIFH